MLMLASADYQRLTAEWEGFSIAMDKAKLDPIRRLTEQPSGQPRSYSQEGLDEAILRQRLVDEADGLVGETVGVAFPGRGALLWHQGAISFRGPAGERGRELRNAVEALLEGVDVSSTTVVRDLLLTMGGARLVVHRLAMGGRGNIRPQ
jgi:hypothetical protein